MSYQSITPVVANTVGNQSLAKLATLVNPD